MLLSLTMNNALWDRTGSLIADNFIAFESNPSLLWLKIDSDRGREIG